MEKRTLEKDFEKGIYLKGVCCKDDSLEYMTLMGADDLVRLFEAFVSGKYEILLADEDGEFVGDQITVPVNKEDYLY